MVSHYGAMQIVHTSIKLNRYKNVHLTCIFVKNNLDDVDMNNIHADLKNLNVHHEIQVQLSSGL